MTVKRMDNVGIVVEDIDAAIEFFAELGFMLNVGDWLLLGGEIRSAAQKWHKPLVHDASSRAHTCL